MASNDDDNLTDEDVEAILRVARDKDGPVPGHYSRIPKKLPEFKTGIFIDNPSSYAVIVWGRVV